PPAAGALSALQKVDRTILRLNRLLASPGGLSAFLSTFNYVLYVLAYLQIKSPAISAFARRILALVRKDGSLKPPTSTLVADGAAAAAAVPSLAAFGALISKARTTLRLFGLFPLYAWLRALLSGPKQGADLVLHRIAVLQASSYFVYQALENVSLLADCGVVPGKVIALINRGDSRTGMVYLWAYRAWLGGVSCDFLRLAREAQIEKQRRATRKQMQTEGKAVAAYQEEEDRKVDIKWWTDLVIASAWFPMALNFSSEKGIPGWNLGWMGLCGLVAGSTRASALWEST
ncbi:hypothetical protein BS50DRAFT_445504, partial [Corynespora cassiicola Philippines]